MVQTIEISAHKGNCDHFNYIQVNIARMPNSPNVLHDFLFGRACINDSFLLIYCKIRFAVRPPV